MVINNEVLIVRTSVLNDTGHDVIVDKQFETIFHTTCIPVGRTEIRFPIQNKQYRNLVSLAERRYPELNFTIGAKTLEEY